MAFVIKYKIPGKVAHSPSWFRDKLADLLVMVEEFGMPALFLTLTADEVSDTRWQEIKDIEEMVKRFNSNYTWKDAPVECARMFHERTQRFMNKFVLCGGEPGVFGTVLHYLIRYEVSPKLGTLVECNQMLIVLNTFAITQLIQPFIATRLA